MGKKKDWKESLVDLKPPMGTCLRCGEYKKLTNDHIIPIAVLKAMGMGNNESFNVQRLCAKCNLTKGSQLDPKNPKTLRLMEYYLRRWQDMYVVARPRRKYVFRMLPVQSLTPDTYHFVESRKALQSIYLKQKGVQM